MNLKVSLRGRRASVCLACSCAFLFSSAVASAQEPAAPSPAPDARKEAPPPAAPPSDTKPLSPGDSASTPSAAAGAAADSASASADSDGQVTTGSGLFEASQEGAGSSASGVSEAPAETGYELNGYVRGDVFVGKEQRASHAEMKAAYSELSLKLKVKKDKLGDAYAEPRFRYGLQGEAQGLIVDLREAYANLYAGPLDLRLGKQIVVWGRADALNPTSNITPVDFRIHSPIEDDRRVGNVGARAFLNFSPFRLEGVWMPLYEATELPPLPLPERAALGDSTYPRPRIENGTEGARLHLELPAIEMSASYVYGYAPLPGLARGEYQDLRTNDAQVLVTRAAYNQQVVGFDFATTLGDWLGLRGEAAYRDPAHFRQKVYAPNPDVQYVLGLDHTFGEVNVIAQYIGRYVFNYVKYPSFNPDTSLLTQMIATADNLDPTVNAILRSKNQILFSQLAQQQHMASLRVEWKALHETLSASALAFVNFTTQEWLLFPKIGYAVSDNMTATVGAEIYEGPSNTLFGVIRSELSAGYAELRMSF